MSTAHTILCVAGARPNFMKIAPVMAALARVHPAIRPVLVHTGQHYDAAMSESFFHQLGIPSPDVDLEVGSASHAVQTAEIMKRFEPLIGRFRPAAVLVVGDVNSTIACALVAAKLGVPVLHVEAGLRSYDRAMPEEINRVLTDQLSDLLFITEADARENLRREGIDPARVHHTGNVMIDTLLAQRAHAVPARETLAAFGATEAVGAQGGGYAVLTLHRPSNVDDAATLAGILRTIGQVADRLPVLFAMHPRTRTAIERFALDEWLAHPRLYAGPPLGYLELLGLMAEARLVLTDSGGLQEETTALGVPCLTLRENTERPITETEGTNTVVGTDPARILASVDEILAGRGKAGRIPPLWDGRAAVRIAETIRDWLGLAPGR